MDEEQKEQKDPKEQESQQNAQETKDAVKDGANLAKNVASGNYVGAVADGVKLAKNKKVRKMVLVSIVIQIAVVVVLASSVFTIFDKVGDVIQGVVDAIINFFNPEEEWDGTIEVSDEDVQAIIDSIKSLRINLDDLKLLGDLDTTGLTEEEIEEKKNEAEKKYIKKFFEAELTTSTLYANKTKVAGKTYGTVYVYRTLDGQDTENATLLTYMKYKEMEEKASKGKIDSIKKYYSIDSEGKLVIPAWKTTTMYNPETSTTSGNGSTEVTLKHVDYRSAISQYTTPTTFFIYLAMVAQNPEFVSAVTELVKDSKINLTIIDTITTETESTEESYTLNEIKVDRATVKTSKDLTYPGITTKTVTDTPSAQITYVKTWFCEQEIKCGSETVTDVDETEVVEKEDEPEPPAPAHGKVTWKTNQKTTKTKKATKIIYKETYRSDVTDRTGEKGDQGVTTDSFKNDKKEVKDDFKLDENSRFLGLIDNKFRIPNSKRYEAAGVNNLKSGATWLFGLLQKDYKLQTLEQIMRLVMQKYTGKDYGADDLDWSIFEIPDFIDISDGISSGDGITGEGVGFGCDLSREEFIAKAKAYNGGQYYSVLTNAAGDFYDICTSEKYNVNPCLAFAWSCMETGYGESIPNNNLFGYAVYNGQTTGKSYATYAESIEDFCDWMVKATTSGSELYNKSYSRAKEFATVNSVFEGTPSSNIYALFCVYMYLGDTHISDEPDFDNPAGHDYYWSHGSNWTSGGRIYLFYMYETGGLYSKQYKQKCGHPSGSDECTLTEKADYAQYSVKKRIGIAKTIFGSECLNTSSGGGAIISGGVTNDQEAAQLQAYFENELLHTKVHNNGEYQNGPFAKWWASGYNHLQPFQCTWWAFGRASMYLEQNGTKYTKYPTTPAGTVGNGGDWFDLNKSYGWFNYGSTPKPNSIVSWKGGTYGHVAYVEGVTSDGIYISHAGSGVSWRGIQKIPLDGTLWSMKVNGYIYLDEPK